MFKNEQESSFDTISRSIENSREYFRFILIIPNWRYYRLE